MTYSGQDLQTTKKLIEQTWMQALSMFSILQVHLICL